MSVLQVTVPMVGGMAVLLGSAAFAWFVAAFHSCVLYVGVTHGLLVVLLGVRLYSRRPHDTDEDAPMRNKLSRNVFVSFVFLMLGSAFIALGLANVKPFLSHYGGEPSTVSSVANASVLSAPTFRFTTPVQWLAAARVGITESSLVPLCHNELTPLQCFHNSGVRFPWVHTHGLCG